MKIKKISVAEQDDETREFDENSLGPCFDCEIPFSVEFEDGEVYEGRTCTCRHGCRGSASIAYLYEGYDFKSAEQFLGYLGGDDDCLPKNADEAVAQYYYGLKSIPKY